MHKPLTTRPTPCLVQCHRAELRCGSASYSHAHMPILCRSVIQSINKNALGDYCCRSAEARARFGASRAPALCLYHPHCRFVRSPPLVPPAAAVAAAAAAAAATAQRDARPGSPQPRAPLERCGERCHARAQLSPQGGTAAAGARFAQSPTPLPNCNQWACQGAVTACRK